MLNEKQALVLSDIKLRSQGHLETLRADFAKAVNPGTLASNLVWTAQKMVELDLILAQIERLELWIAAGRTPAKLHKALTDEILDWEPNQSTSLMQRLVEERRLAALKEVRDVVSLLVKFADEKAT